MANAAFEEWMAEVDGQLLSICKLTHNDLSDQPWYSWFESGLTPYEGAMECLSDTSECFPFPFED